MAGMVDYAHLGELSRAMMGPNDQSLYDVLASKSTKKSKTTGVSPWETALKSAANKIRTAQGNINDREIKAAQAAHDKVVKDAEEAQKKADKQHEYDLAHPEQAQKQQDEQWKAFVQGLDIARAKGTLTQKYGGDLPDWRDEAALRDPYPLAGLSPSQASQATSTISELPPELRPTGPPKSPAGAPATGPTPVETPSAPSSESAAAAPDLSTPVGKATLKVSTLQDQIAKQQILVNAIQEQQHKNDPFDIFSPGDYVDAAAQLGHNALSVAGTGLNWISKPGNYVLAATNKLVDDVKSGDWQAAVTGVDALKAGWDAAAHDKNMVSGQQLLENLGMPDIPVLTPTLGMGAEIALDPSTYLSGGIVPASKNALIRQLGVRAQVDIDQSLLRQAAKLATAPGFTTATGKLIPKTAKKEVNDISKVIQAGGAVGLNMTKTQQLAHDVISRELAHGASLPVAEASGRIAVENQMLSDLAFQREATLARNAAVDNQRMVDIRVLGKSTGLGRLPVVSVPYQAIRNAKGVISNTTVGQAIREAFDMSYWFPGNSQTLWNKAQSAGVQAMQEEKNRISEVWKGLSKAEKRRVADETELGHDLSGEISKNGKDLGEIQKFWRQSNAEKFAEQVSTTGKYTPGQEVKDLVFHYYQRGSKDLIAKTRRARRLRLRDGATGTDRVTLQDAEDLGLKPIREGDRIMLAQAADHQRQLTNEAFHRMIIEHYGIATPNNIWAHDRGLVEIKPPKSASVKPGTRIYAQPDIARVYNAIGKFGSRDEEAVAKFMKHVDSVTRYWKMANTSLRPGHHINNFIGDVFMNFLDGVTNPYRYWQGLKLLSGDRSQVSLNVGNQHLTGDQIYDLIGRSGMMQGFIGTELMEGRNPLIKGINEFSQRRELFVRYAHFMDALKKEGDKVALGANNKAGLMQAATRAAKQVNKWNINYGALTPIERDYFRRAMPFYTWSRKSLPLFIEAMATRPGRVTAITKLNNWISNVAGVDPFDMQGIPVQDWVKDQGYARISNGSEPNIWSIPFPATQGPASWFGRGELMGHGGTAEKFVTSLHPLIQLPFEAAQAKNLFTGAPLDTSPGAFSQDLFGIIRDAVALSKTGQSEADTIKAINALSGIGIMKDTENAQISALHQEQNPLSHEIAVANAALKTKELEVNKLKNGYRVYDTFYKVPIKDFGNQADAYVYAMNLAKTRKPHPKAAGK